MDVPYTLWLRANIHTYLVVIAWQNMSKKAEEKSEVLKRDEGHTRTHVVYKLQIWEQRQTKNKLLCLSPKPQLDTTGLFSHSASVSRLFPVITVEECGDVEEKRGSMGRGMHIYLMASAWIIYKSCTMQCRTLAATHVGMSHFKTPIPRGPLSVFWLCERQKVLLFFLMRRKFVGRSEVQIFRFFSCMLRCQYWDLVWTNTGKIQGVKPNRNTSHYSSSGVKASYVTLTMFSSQSVLHSQTHVHTLF